MEEKNGEEKGTSFSSPIVFLYFKNAFSLHNNPLINR